MYFYLVRVLFMTVHETANPRNTHHLGKPQWVTLSMGSRKINGHKHFDFSECLDSNTPLLAMKMCILHKIGTARDDMGH